MDLTPIFHDPRLMFSEFGDGVARFIPMTRESYAQSIFFDRRVQPASGQSIEVPLNVLLEHLRETGFKPPRLRFIHHFAHSGSTLLARALEHPSNLVIREPGHLRQLGIGAGAGFTSRSAPQPLALSLTMLGKRFSEGSSVIVKGNVPISLLAEIIAEVDPGQPAIMLYFSLEDYCAAVLRSPGHQNWVNRVTADIGLSKDRSIGDIAGLSVAEKAAALWLSMVRRFERMLSAHPQMRSLDGNQLFDQPAQTIGAASDLLEAGLSPEEVEGVANGPLLTSYSKNPAVPFDNEARRKLRSDAKAQLSGELLAARRWVDRKIADDPLPEGLARPLIGESPSLL
jgi:hypothetical protein